MTSPDHSIHTTVAENKSATSPPPEWEEKTAYDLIIFRVSLELLSTVHWVIYEEAAETLQDVVKRTYDWNDRKKQFARRQIELAVNIMSRKGWIENADALNTA